MLKPFFTYFGGKWRVAKQYPAPLHDTIIEPFAGSAGYALRYADRQVILCDKNPVIAGVWSYLLSASKSDILSLPLDIVDLRQSTSLSPQEKWLIGFWLNKGTTAPRNVPSKWMRDKWRPNSNWGEVIRQRIADQVEHIRHWRIKECSYSELENASATWFIDPPYERSGKRYKFSDIDYSELANWCQTRSGQIIVCEQQGANWLPFAHFRKTKSLEGRRGKHVSNETMYYKEQQHGAL